MSDIKSASNPGNAMLAYQSGYEQGRVNAEKWLEHLSQPLGPEPPRESFTYETWQSLPDHEKIAALLRRLHPLPNGFAEVMRVLASLDHADRELAIKGIDSVICMGCGVLQRIDQDGDLRWCRCQDDF